MSRGSLLVLAAYVFWGLTPLFWRLLAAVPAAEQLAHRVVWAFPLLLAFSWATKGYRSLAGATGRDWGRFALSGLLLAANWGTFVYAVAAEQVVAASLGYYLNPLVSVFLGVVVLGERLRPLQLGAIATAAAGVVYLTLAVGALPWITLVLALSFGLYGLMQKRHGSVGPWTSLGAEIVWLVPAALAGILVWGSRGVGSFGPGPTWLLVATGPVTIIPLLLFGAGARRIPLTTVGVLQYVAPTLQLLVGVVIFGEPFPAERLAAFALVWVGVCLYVWDLVRTVRRPPAPTG